MTCSSGAVTHNDFYKIISNFWLFPSFKLYNTHIHNSFSICRIILFAVLFYLFQVIRETKRNGVLVSRSMWIPLTFDIDLRSNHILLCELFNLLAKASSCVRGELYGAWVLSIAKSSFFILMSFILFSEKKHKNNFTYRNVGSLSLLKKENSFRFGFCKRQSKYTSH